MSQYDQEILGAQQQAEHARRLKEGYKTLDGQMVSGYYVPPAATQQLAELLKTYLGASKENSANEKVKSLQDKKSQALAEALKGIKSSKDDNAIIDMAQQDMPTAQLAAALRKTETVPPAWHMIETPQGQQLVNANDPNAPKSFGPKPKQDNTLVSVIGPDGVTPVLVSRKDAAGMQPYVKPTVGKGGTLTPEQKEQAQLTTQQTLDQLEKLFKHPGREAATGASSFSSMIPATDAKGFASELKTFQAKAFLDAVQKMKGLGALTEAEGQKLVSSIGALDPDMKEEDFAENLKSIAREMRDTAKAKGYDVNLPAFAAESQTQGGGWSIRAK